MMPDPEPAPAGEKITFRDYAEKWMAGTVANNLKYRGESVPHPAGG